MPPTLPYFEPVMEQPLQICPQCKNTVAFVEFEGKRRCPECGFEFALSPPVVAAEEAPRSVLTYGG